MKPLLFILSLLLLALACGGNDDDDDSGDMRDAGDAEDWLEAEPGDVGMDASALEAVRDYAFHPEMNTQALLIIKDGYLVAEWYAEGHDAASYATSWSVAKSYTSTVLGMLYDDGLWSDLGQSMADYFPEWAGTEKAEITLRDLLTMSSGLEWSESYDASIGNIQDSDAIQIVLSSTPLDRPAGKPLVHQPGSYWSYSSGDTMLLSHVIKVLGGQSATEIARQRLFGPMGMHASEWWLDSVDNTYTWCCLDAPSREFAKFGQLFLQRGVWGGERLLSETWVDMIVGERANAYAGYGLQWWLNHPDSPDFDSALPADLYMALGHDGQSVGIFPSQRLVVVRNGLYIKPEGPAVATNGLYAAGLVPSGMGVTGSISPGDAWSEEELYKLVLKAME